MSSGKILQSSARKRTDPRLYRVPTTCEAKIRSSSAPARAKLKSSSRWCGPALRVTPGGHASATPVTTCTMNASIVTRLKEDVIDPARAKGYDRIWLIGNSLGGFGSLSYVREHPNEISGIVLLGPFLGERELIKDIRHSGGLLLWEPGDVLLKTKEDAEKHIWIWLKEHTQKGQFGAGERDCPKGQGCVPKIYLGYGTYDRFTYAQDLLASLLPPEQVIAINGGHDWSTWKKLWQHFLDQNIFRP